MNRHNLSPLHARYSCTRDAPSTYYIMCCVGELRCRRSYTFRHKTKRLRLLGIPVSPRLLPPTPASTRGNPPFILLFVRLISYIVTLTPAFLVTLHYRNRASQIEISQPLEHYRITLRPSMFLNHRSCRFRGRSSSIKERMAEAWRAGPLWGRPDRGLRVALIQTQRAREYRWES